jgi:predicted nucleic acid-binding protein
MDFFLLDADAVIDQLKGFPETVRLLERLYEAGGELCVCDVTIAEIYAGLDPQDRARAEQLLEACSFLVSSAAIAQQAGEWRYQYRRQGITISLTDALIAATAYSHGAQVVTGNVDDYPMPEVSTIALPRRRRQS